MKKEFSKKTFWFLSFVPDPAFLDDQNYIQQSARAIDEATGSRDQLAAIMGPEAIDAAIEAFQDDFDRVFSDPNIFIKEMEKASQEFKDSLKNDLPINPLLKYYSDLANIAKDMKDLGLNISFKEDILKFAETLQQRGPGVYNAAKQNIEYLLSQAKGIKTGDEKEEEKPKDKKEKSNYILPALLLLIIVIFVSK